jgi:hypothetical protein
MAGDDRERERVTATLTATGTAKRLPPRSSAAGSPADKARDRVAGYVF